MLNPRPFSRGKRVLPSIRVQDKRCKVAGGAAGGPGRYLLLLGTAMVLIWPPSAPVWADSIETVKKVERLSIWLPPRLQGPGVEPYLEGLVWSLPEEEPSQRRMKSALLVSLQDKYLSQEISQTQRTALTRFVADLPITGRVVLGKTDPRWLEVHPALDPLLQPGQRILLPARPLSVSLLTGDGRLCQVRHVAGAHALDYAHRCGDVSPTQAWIVQPDGIVQHRRIADWNQEKQDTPAPGAWIVVDALPWHYGVLEQLARILATQGPAPDRGELLSEPVIPGGLVSSVMGRERPRDLEATSGDWAGIGLLQTPTARMAPAGSAAISLSQAVPYTRLNFNLQPLSGLETSFRYTDVSNIPYGPGMSQSYKDKSIDMKVSLHQETTLLPEIAAGIRDLTGTGLFSGEYLVGSKRTGNLDWSLGLGWGYVGKRGDVNNPLSHLSSGFDTRKLVVGNGGQFSPSAYFHGPAAFFGGVQYQTPWEPLILKLEYDGNDYQHEPFGGNQVQKSPFNVGAVYRYSDNVDLALALERGNTATWSATFHGRLDTLSTPKFFDPKPVAVSRFYPSREPDWKATQAELEAATGWKVVKMQRAGTELLVCFDQVSAFYWNDAIDRIAAILHRDTPKSTLVFRIQNAGNPLHGNESLIDRATWVDAKTRVIAPFEKKFPVYANPYADGFVDPYADTLVQSPSKTLTGDLSPYLQQGLGGPDGFILYQVGARLSAKWQMRPDTWIDAAEFVRVLDNYDQFKVDGPSDLPRVRTDIRKYVESSRATMPLLQMTHVGRLASDQYFSVYGGMLETMFGGVGAEWLYRSWGSPVALGVDVNAVRQRGFDQAFSFLNYSVATGHMTLYWDTGISDIHTDLSVGRYLAGDVGATLDVSRGFGNGVNIGAWMTKTNVSSAQFGEGSFDKGIYVKIPFDAMMMTSSGSTANLIWQPLMRDGGAKLNRAVTLETLTRGSKGQDLQWRAYGEERTSQFGDVRDGIPEDDRRMSALSALGQDVSSIGQDMTHTNFWKSVLVAGGLTAVSTAFDKPADTLAQKYGGKSIMKGVEFTGKYLPFLALGYSGLMTLGEHDTKFTQASFSSVEAGGVGVLAAFGLKLAVGRARPLSDLGPGSFTPMSSSNGSASFPSIHSTLAWAALTPYAKAYDQPWLYALAAVTNVSRIGERKHWFSDTVAGSLLGYGLGSLFWESRQQHKSLPSFYLAPNEIGLQWRTP